MRIFVNNKTRRILEELRHHARAAKEIFEEIFPHNPDTFKVTKRLLGYMTPPRKPNFHELKRIEENKFYALLSKLRTQGIVKKRGVGARALFNLTNNGLKKLIRYAEQKERINIPKKIYNKKKTKDDILIIFDIPEVFKQYRNWIRYQLSLFGFEMLQKSVWIGNYEIPADFIHDLREYNMLQYIHIFKVIKKRSI
ncbi:MAG: hypothetical protein A3I89_02295 [Candidatus Harrisonbacteria bacterium RIFCSPLOWO2_02_FULL_41_11]|uniref:Transcriptional repressor PaaX-like central Cas2-like domain-containing protein n=1 Tax=Candidatus Harrisonbacteria bacterium RIFCSPHIGHO2_02_FULL_42_16 TaxID=1798404 RepID=A0A1G1ZK48_9BACT|nr:MAG: hypothetical protein A3B92_03585 [Candidatus Harrisonbacteria bacterium RIFCSPHIGHO2_02_FULL_42_16]OGY66622.1 MAG: hypothetical protein A3I89_02295 [Candidatus Harrisonbacteria bacterium RIFCSPLOWO2_02_FULL_41_11]